MSPGINRIPSTEAIHDLNMRFDSLSAAARTIWAKSGELQGHGLMAHMLDVAAVAQCILRREPAAVVSKIAGAFGVSVDAVIGWIAAMAGLHDLGKGIPGFQNKWTEGRIADEAAGLSFPARLLSIDEHDKASAFELRALLRERLGFRAPAVANAVAAHHGYVFTSKEIDNVRRVGEPPAWLAARNELFAAYWATLNPPETDSEDLPVELPAFAWLAGLTSVADWIGSNIEWFPLGERHPTLAGHHADALDRAEAALDAIGWPAHRSLLQEPASTSDLIARIVGQQGLTARPLQRTADELLKDVQGPALIIVEAPMGEGKTELALLAHLRLQAALGHRGLYIGLPTQATGNAMFDRALRFLHAFGHEQPLDIQLAHGGALLDARLVELRGIHGEKGDNVRSSAWFSQRRRPLLSPYGVGTIDQALFATLNVKHHFVRLWGLANRVVVLDEVHAYDTYTGELIEALLRWLKPLGCSVVLMSATLPQHKRDAMLRAWGIAPADVPELAYPRVLVASDTQVRGSSYPSRPLAPIELHALDEELESIAHLANDLLRQGGCGAVIVNTVDRAQQLYLKLKDMVEDPAALMLFHARYPADERSARENAVLAAFGKTQTQPRQALLVATQVVEQSLDIDFDFLISDLAPMDLLLQRAGRLHRHERDRPAAHAVARLYVAGLLAQRKPELKKTAWGAIYDPYILCRTWAFASRESEWHLPHDIDRLVQTVYGDVPIPDGISPADRQFIEVEAYGGHLGKIQNERLFARNAALHAEDAPQDAYAGKPRGGEEGEGLGASNQTRLGDESVTVLPVHVDGGAWRLHPGDSPFDPAVKPTHEHARRMLARQVKLSRKALVAALNSTDVPAGIAEHPWLRDIKPLRLQNGMLSLGKWQVVLDPELGIVYRNSDAPTNTPALGETP